MVASDDRLRSATAGGGDVMALALLVAAVGVWPSSAAASRAFGTPRREAKQAAERTASPMAVAHAMDLIALALAGGAPTVVALEAVSASCGPGVREPLARVAAAMRWGVDDEGAWASVSQVWRPVAGAFALASRVGAPPSALLRRAAADLRTSEGERVAVAGAKAGVRIVLPLGACFLPAFVLLTVVPLILGLVEPFG